MRLRVVSRSAYRRFHFVLRLDAVERGAAAQQDFDTSTRFRAQLLYPVHFNAFMARNEATAAAPDPISIKILYLAPGPVYTVHILSG